MKNTFIQPYIFCNHFSVNFLEGLTKSGIVDEEVVNDSQFFESQQRNCFMGINSLNKLLKISILDILNEPSKRHLDIYNTFLPKGLVHG